MKTRLDFVTNSSSSSFIVATKLKVPSDESKKLIKEVAYAMGAHEIALELADLEEFFEEICGSKDRWGLYEKRAYEEAIALISQGNIIYTTSISSDDPTYTLRGQVLYCYC